MDGLMLGGFIFVSLIVAVVYHRSIPDLSTVEKAAAKDRLAKSLIWLPILLTIGNFWILNLESPIEAAMASMFFWLNIIFFFLIFLKYRAPRIALLTAVFLAEFLLIVASATGSEFINSLLLITSYIAAVSLVLKRFAPRDSVLIAAFLLMTVFDIIFVWLAPIIPTLEAAAAPLLFSPLVKIAALTLGSGDVIFLILAMLVLAKKISYLAIVLLVSALSVSVLITLAVKNLINMPYDSFPFLVILTPVFLTLYTFNLIKPRN